MSHLFPSIIRIRTRLVSLGLMLALLFQSAGCITDPEYAQRLAHARTDCKGHEIVGIWHSAIPAGRGRSYRTSLLIRSDGTGVFRNLVGTVDFTWRYNGSGEWSGVAKQPIPSKMFFHFDGSHVLLAGGGASYVFINTHDTAGMEEHMNRIR
ncbi:MAG: hypothetical protein U1F71_14015 [Verrucomicrobiaceae bacterium]